ncbi:hypothetical protein K4K61_003268 [Colletotrichum sp. SAR11_59]|uniref:Nad dependent epimerase dehydratase family protein n=1 Tax=Colletotrichum asianum TaxID=702518 RepID=A0A8H3WKJ3_9PEZI|nr:nad dependent epimerase dehydratase family protein [Colletotrichum asianum]KAI8316614.1 hypothetical protein K4K61_003268 [Colletotrichum sp. SAR11_59]
MTRVLILGGAGYIGLAVAQALIRSGNYTVFATSRSDTKTKLLALNEVKPLIGELSDINFVKATIAENRIDVVIDLSQAYSDATTILEAVTGAAQDRASRLATENSIGPKLGFVYCSGSWVHGSPRDQRISDTSVPSTFLAADKPATAVAWRPAHEQAVLKSRDILDVAIVRPGAVYGRGSWVMTAWWGKVLDAAKSGDENTIEIPAYQETRTGVVCVDDLADGFVRVVDRLPTFGSWPVFDFVSETVPISTMMEEVKRVIGAKGALSYVGCDGNPFFEALALVCNATSGRARAELGWSSKRTEFVRDLPQLVAAWEASQ